MSKPDWLKAPAGAKWLAQDADGSWWWFDSAPVICDGGAEWGEFWANHYVGSCQMAGWDDPSPNWRDSSEPRP